MLEYVWVGPNWEQSESNWYNTWMPAEGWYPTRKLARQAKKDKEFSMDYCWEFRIVKYYKVP